MTYGDSSSSSSDEQCTLEFWYHMMGDHVGSLNVFKYTKKGYTLLQNITQAQAADWVEGRIPLANDGPFKLEFEGIRGSEYQGDIALDDIEV